MPYVPMCPPNIADVLVLADVRRAVAAARATGLAYADDDWSPISDITLEGLAGRAGIVISKRPLPPELFELVTPPTAGVYPMVLNRDHTWGCKRFALRHGLGHVLAGHVNEIAFMSTAGDYMAHEERVADLFALMDAIPDRVLATLRDAGYSDSEVQRWVYAEIARWTGGWEPARIRDRVALRLGGS